MQANITFNLERNMDSAIQDVRDKMAQTQGRFPRDTQPARVTKYDPDSQPILTLAISGGREAKELTEIVDKRIKQVLETVNNVGGIEFNGGRRRQIQLLLDGNRLTAYGLTATQVQQQNERPKNEIPGGKFIPRPLEIPLPPLGPVDNLLEF